MSERIPEPQATGKRLLQGKSYDPFPDWTAAKIRAEEEKKKWKESEATANRNMGCILMSVCAGLLALSIGTLTYVTRDTYRSMKKISQKPTRSPQMESGTTKILEKRISRLRAGIMRKDERLRTFIEKKKLELNLSTMEIMQAIVEGWIEDPTEPGFFERKEQQEEAEPYESNGRYSPDRI